MKKIIYFLPLLIVILSCTVQNRYHRKGYTVNWNHIPVNHERTASVNIEQLVNTQDLATNNEELHLPAKTSFYDASINSLSSLGKEDTGQEPNDSIEKQLKRKRFNRNLIISSLGAIGLGGILQYINYSNRNIPNIENSSDYKDNKIGSEISYAVGGAGLLASLIKIGVEDSKKVKESIIKNQQAVVVYDSTTTQQNNTLNEGLQKNKEIILNQAQRKADIALFLSLFGILTTSVFGLGILFSILAIITANKSIIYAPNGPSAMRARTAKQLSKVWLIILGCILLLPILLIAILFSY
jgi:hypothetical protein